MTRENGKSRQNANGNQNNGILPCEVSTSYTVNNGIKDFRFTRATGLPLRLRVTSKRDQQSAVDVGSKRAPGPREERRTVPSWRRHMRPVRHPWSSEPLCAARNLLCSHFEQDVGYSTVIDKQGKDNAPRCCSAHATSGRLCVLPSDEGATIRPLHCRYWLTLVS